MKQDTIIFLFFYLFAILIGIIKTGEYGKPILMASTLFGIIYAILYYRKAIREGFEEAETPLYRNRDTQTGHIESPRFLRFGDIVTLWNPTLKRYIQTDALPTNDVYRVGTTSVLERSTDIPGELLLIQFVITDPTQSVDLGNSNPLEYGQPFVLRSLQAFRGSVPLYLSPDATGVFLRSPKTHPANSLVLLNPQDATAKGPVRYGSPAAIRTKDATNPFLQILDGKLGLIATTGDASTFYILDRFGNGQDVDWARRSQVEQSSTLNDLQASFAIDQSEKTYSSTRSQIQPWWRATLPQAVDVSRIQIQTRAGTTLSSFDVELYNERDQLIAKRVMTVVQNSVWDGVRKRVKRVRIIVPSTKEEILEIQSVQIFGQAVAYRSVYVAEDRMVQTILDDVYEVKADVRNAPIRKCNNYQELVDRVNALIKRLERMKRMREAMKRLGGDRESMKGLETYVRAVCNLATSQPDNVQLQKELGKINEKYGLECANLVRSQERLAEQVVRTWRDDVDDLTRNKAKATSGAVRCSESVKAGETSFEDADLSEIEKRILAELGSAEQNILSLSSDIQDRMKEGKLTHIEFSDLLGRVSKAKKDKDQCVLF